MTRQLKDIRLEQASAIDHLDRINKAEIKALKELEKAKNKVTVEESFPFIKGDILRVTNRLRDKYRKVGKVKKICKTQVTIQNSGTGRKYCRAWYSLELVKSASGDHPRNKRK